MPVSCCRKRISTAMRIGRYTRGSRASAHDTRLLWNTKLLLRGYARLSSPGHPVLAPVGLREISSPLPRETQPPEAAWALPTSKNHSCLRKGNQGPRRPSECPEPHRALWSHPCCTCLRTLSWICSNSQWTSESARSQVSACSASSSRPFESRKRGELGMKLSSRIMMRTGPSPATASHLQGSKRPGERGFGEGLGPLNNHTALPA